MELPPAQEDKKGRNMEILILLGVAWLIWIFFIDGNKKSIEDKTTVETTRTIEIDGVKQVIKRKTVLTNNQRNAGDPTKNLDVSNLGIIEPTEREGYLQQKLNESLKQQQVLEQKINQLQQLPKPTYKQQELPFKDLDTNSLKQCSKCLAAKPIDAFRPNHNQPDGLTKWCASCLDSQQPQPPNMKICPKCKQNRRKSSFYKSSKYPDGLTKWCKYCLRKLH